MNVPLRHATASSQLAIVDCDIHPALRRPPDLHPFLPARWRDAHDHLRRASAARPVGAAGVAAHDGRRHAGRCLSGGRAARLRSRADAPPASRCQRRRIRHADAAQSRRNGGAQSRIRRRAFARDQRLATGDMGEEGAAAARRHRRAARGRRLRRHRDRAPRGRSGLRPDHHLAARERPARTSALLADLRRGRAERSADRAACPGVQRRPCLDRLRAGPPITCRSITRPPATCRRRSPAWCSRACSSASRSSRSC